jgi:hypothetical protein
MDLICAGGQVMLVEREPRPEEIGCRPVGLDHSLVVRVIRGAQTFGFREPHVEIAAGDRLIALQSRVPPKTDAH